MQYPTNISKPCETFQWHYYISVSVLTHFHHAKVQIFACSSLFCMYNIKFLIYTAINYTKINIISTFTIQWTYYTNGFIFFWKTKCHTTIYLSVVIPTQCLYKTIDIQVYLCSYTNGYRICLTIAHTIYPSDSLSYFIVCMNYLICGQKYILSGCPWIYLSFQFPVLISKMELLCL